MAIFDELKSVGKILQEAGKIEQYQQILDAQEKLLEMQKRIFDLELENKELRDKLNQKQQMILENNVYWEGCEKIKGPFCKVCYEKDNKMITLDIGTFDVGLYSSDINKHYCRVCKNYFK